jgi:hypothetical protein
MIQYPDWVMPIVKDENILPDLDLILSIGHASLSEQASALSAAIATTSEPRSSRLVTYAIALLNSGSSRDRITVAQAIETSSLGAFSAVAKNTLLWGLWNWLREQENPDDSVVHLLVTITVRYLAETNDSPVNTTTTWSLAPPDLRGPIVHYDVPWILGSERAMSILRRELAPALADRARLRASQIATRGDGQFTAVDRERLRRFAEVAGHPEN